MITPSELHTDASISYCQVPTFGHDTIQWFRHNVSELKQMAARDFEDLLQVKFMSSSFISPDSPLEYQYF